MFVGQYIGGHWRSASGSVVWMLDLRLGQLVAQSRKELAFGIRRLGEGGLSEIEKALKIAASASRQAGITGLRASF